MITPEQAESGVVIRATSPICSKFKLLHFEQGEGGVLELSLQEDSQKVAAQGKDVPKMSQAGLYFLNFQNYTLDQINTLKMAQEEQDAILFKRLDSLKPRETSAIRAGAHVFGVYGDNFFESARFVVEALVYEHGAPEPKALREAEQEILTKKDELRKFEGEYKAAKAAFEAAVLRYNEESETLQSMLRRRDAAYANMRTKPAEGTAVAVATANGDAAAAALEHENGKEGGGGGSFSGMKGKFKFPTSAGSFSSNFKSFTSGFKFPTKK